MEAGLQNDLNGLIRKLRGIEGVVTKDVKDDLRQAGSVIVSAIQGRAPIGTRSRTRKGVVFKPGNLRKSIRVLPLRRTKNAVVLGPISRGRAPDGFYARFLEFGTKNMAAQPFIAPAVDASLPQAQRFALELLKRRVEKYAQQNSV